MAWPPRLHPRSPCLCAAVLRPVSGFGLPSCTPSPRGKLRLGCSLELRGEAWSPTPSPPPQECTPGGGSEAPRLSKGLPCLQTARREGRWACSTGGRLPPGPRAPLRPQLALLRAVPAHSGKGARLQLGFGREPSRDTPTRPAREGWWQQVSWAPRGNGGQRPLTLLVTGSPRTPRKFPRLPRCG